MKTKRTIRPKRSHRLPSRPSIAQIDLQAISFNLKGVRAKVGKSVAVMAVVKANAYGHGIEAVSRFVERSLADYFGVAFAEEGILLREAGIEKPVHVFTLPAAGQGSLFVDFGLEPTIASVSDVDLLRSSAERSRRGVDVHLKIETGMNRIGVRHDDLESVLKRLAKARRIRLKGVFTHFANSDEKDKGFMREQLSRFEQGLETIGRLGFDPAMIHCANSAAILDAPETYFSMVRPGVMMYGYYPSRTTSESVPLKPAMSIRTRVSLVKWIEPGETVSYGRRYTATKRTRIATLPLGYADGFTRLLSGKASVLVRGNECPVAGTICMDQLMVDVGDAEVAPGDEAVLVGAQGRRSITAWDIASKLGTIPYEICCAISSRVPRVYTT